MPRCSHVLCLALPLMLASATATGQEADWKAGLASVKITPGQPLFMSGYASRNKPYESVRDDLYAKALVLEDAAGERGVWITSDLIGFTAAVSDPVRQRIAEATGIAAERVLLNASHTHTGPSLSLDPAPRDGRSAGDSERTAAYTRELQDQIVALAAEAAKNLQPANLSWGVGVVHFAMNRREFTIERGVILGVNPRGLADRSVPVLRIDGADGQLRAIVFGAACHNTTLGGDIYDITGDFAGHAQKYLQEQHPAATAMFVQGCAGDANPYPRGTHEIAERHGRELAAEVARVLEGRLAPVRGPLRIARGEVALPLASPPSREQLEKDAAGRNSTAAGTARQMLARLDRGEKLPTDYTVPVAVWQFGDDLTLVALPGEVVVDYVRLIEDALGPNRLWISAYNDDVFGYIPSARVLREGGYETRGIYTGGVGAFAPEAEAALVGKVRELASAVGRGTSDRNAP